MGTRANGVLGTLVIVGVAALLAKLALSPLYPRYTAAECQQAYATAQTMADTARVDLHPYDPARRAANRRCGEVRTASTGARVIP